MKEKTWFWGLLVLLSPGDLFITCNLLIIILLGTNKLLLLTTVDQHNNIAKSLRSSESKEMLVNYMHAVSFRVIGDNSLVSFGQQQEWKSGCQSHHCQVSSVGRALVCWAGPGGSRFKPWPDQHSGSLNNWEENAAFVMTSANS